MIEVPALTFVPAQPVNLMELLEAQVMRLIEIGMPKEVGVEEAKFKDNAMALSKAFAYSMELAAIQLDRVWFVHYGVRDRFLADAGEVNLYTNPDKFTLYKGVTTPSGLWPIQGQLGRKYQNRKPNDIRQQHDPLEQLGIPKEGLTAYLYWGKDLLRESNHDYPGAVSGDGNVPCLDLNDETPGLGNGTDDSASPYFGSVSVSRGS